MVPHIFIRKSRLRPVTTNIASRALTSHLIELSRKANSKRRCDLHGGSTTTYLPSCLCQKQKGIRRRATPHYRRFATAAEAIRFAVEEMPALRTLGAWMQVGDERFNSDEISKLYESSGYPLQRDVSR